VITIKHWDFEESIRPVLPNIESNKKLTPAMAIKLLTVKLTIDATDAGKMLRTME
jgi:hypothetical protein